MGREPEVLLLYNEPVVGGLASEAGVLAEVAAVRAGLELLGLPYREAGVRTLEEALATVAVGGEGVVFNLVEGFATGGEDAAQVVAVAAGLGRGCTGNTTACLALTLDKVRTKGVLREYGVPVPDGVVVAMGEAVPPLPAGVGPWIVKPVATDASEGIDAERSVVRTAGPELAAAVARVHRDFRQAALVERLAGSRELNVSLLERGGGVEVLPLAEIDFSAFGPERPRIVDYAAKWDVNAFSYHHTPRLLPAPLDAALAERVRKVARAAWQAVGCQDYARVDLRLSDAGDLFVLEVNANPDLSPDAGFVAALGAAGLAMADFVAAVVDNARRRRPVAVPPPVEAAASGAGGVAVRPLERGDRDAVLEVVRRAAVFRLDEQEIAREVLDDTLARGAAAGYYGLVARLAGRIVGWASYGPIPCTVGAYDLYWVVVDKAARRQRVASTLIAEVERQVGALGGRLIAIETSSRPAYTAARALYGRCGYADAARVAELYGPGDDKCVFVKHLPAGR
ncbi:MAG: hypothetical protein COW73_10795 [Nitrospirae bacterium CG18_big_fil_WC_8_21_14_2_50_70_55]|nr:GNAT family N-acetyltransferase [Deltaproteobacteria bacterium]OIP62802.1 MAG: hypothetical protein AUK30_09540 [Nitrospirae bacterium CG2_30_70_394]PIQ03466.1 MAG: hypothetical protein COW73_10795 [Nitrospirae bacterium CG18_big_fil_WC_8_21_14_2_50_70_55]PIU79947.1 MAG: hypothetical protein COS73_01805 [Nitrospirae bacterium CG06_land_8_20_14_3_00_70_43]PIW82287.1 MAG: hypothetical protein COZ96_09435 [Nitrospirae bacterium CG_4_8_14_3_um_filter_70_85]PIX82944.1 MAG: hypothetical protein C